jgi:hypothetical protein
MPKDKWARMTPFFKVSLELKIRVRRVESRQEGQRQNSQPMSDYLNVRTGAPRVALG